MSSDALKDAPSETEEFASAPEDAESDQAEEYSEACEKKILENVRCILDGWQLHLSLYWLVELKWLPNQ